MSPDPPTENSFVKLWHEGLYDESEFPHPGNWSTSNNIRKNGGSMNMRIPKGLKAGYYLIRAEMIGLHEGDVSFEKNPIRGAQFYPNCVQVEVTGDGDVELPEGVSFPGAYDYDTPGVVYDVSPVSHSLCYFPLPHFPLPQPLSLTRTKVYCSTNTKTTTSTSCTTTYPIPGPTVWSGAWADTTSVPRGNVEGVTTHVPWSTWMGPKSVVSSATYTDKKSVTVVGTSTYSASWGSVYETPKPANKTGHW